MMGMMRALRMGWVGFRWLIITGRLGSFFHVCFMGIVRRLFDLYILTVLFFSLTRNWVGSKAQWEAVSFSG